MKCEHCPAGWEQGGMTDCGYECESCGCLILGGDLFDDDCKLSAKEIERRLQQLKDYEAGKIERPQWVANRFMRELDHEAGIHGGPEFHYSYPPVKMTRGVYFPLYGSISLKSQGESDYRRGYEDAQTGKEPNYHDGYKAGASYSPNAVTTDGEKLFTYEAALTMNEAIEQFNIWTEQYRYDIEKAWIVKREPGKEVVWYNLERKWRLRT